MLAKGWEVTGCDVSKAMLERARAKVGEEVRLSVADMRELPRFGAFDLVWALDDAVNYLLSIGELEAALNGMRSNLAAGGLLMFDLNTLLAYRTFGAEKHVVESGNQRFIWSGQAASDIPPGSICDARFEARGEGVETEAHLHRQRHFPETDVLAALENAGLKCLDVFGHSLDGRLRQPLDEAEHTKAVYIAAQLDVDG
jgi:SAM-dependent methyltransferase